jgi:hypothetical protein
VRWLPMFRPPVLLDLTVQPVSQVLLLAQPPQCTALLDRQLAVCARVVIIARMQPVLSLAPLDIFAPMDP